MSDHSQNDPRWKNVRMGISNRTIGQDGCLVSCMSAILGDEQYRDDPAGLNRWLSRNKGYVDGNHSIPRSVLIGCGCDISTRRTGWCLTPILSPKQCPTCCY